MVLSKTEIVSSLFFVVEKSIVGANLRICLTVAASSMMMAVDSASIAVTPHPFLGLGLVEVFEEVISQDKPVIHRRVANGAQTIVRKRMFVIPLPGSLESFLDSSNSHGVREGKAASLLDVVRESGDSKPEGNCRAAE